MRGLIPFNKRSNNALGLSSNSLYNMLDDFFNDDFMPLRSFTRDSFKIDVMDSDSEYKINAELPGVNKEEINIDLNDGRLTISVVKDESVNEENNNYVHRERRQSSMSRSVYLADVNSEGIKAKLENGILALTIPKIEKVNSASKIEIE